MRENAPHLTALLAYLDTALPDAPLAWNNWHVSPIAGGANNRLYHAANGEQTCAIKLTIRDERDRAGREYAALRVIKAAGADFAPRAVLLDRDTYRQPVIVQSWLDGNVLAAPPHSAAQWDALMQHYCAIHRITPERTPVVLRPATINVASGKAGKVFIREHAERIPHAARPTSLAALLKQVEAWQPPEWAAPPVALCRVDSNWRNFIVRPTTGWASVDWENSGWGDPAFEWADLMTHPSYPSDAPWQELVDQYAAQMNDITAPLRIQTYYAIMLAWWVVRMARFLYEVPRGLDPRLVVRPANWQEQAQRQYDDFLARATLTLGHS